MRYRFSLFAFFSLLSLTILAQKERSAFNVLNVFIVDSTTGKQLDAVTVLMYPSSDPQSDKHLFECKGSFTKKVKKDLLYTIEVECEGYLGRVCPDVNLLPSNKEKIIIKLHRFRIGIDDIDPNSAPDPENDPDGD
jgi:hypothetical protein